MSLFSTLRSAAHSSLALSGAIRVTSDNIAGANDKNYDRQTANLVANPWTGGVRLMSVTRAVQPMLETLQRLKIGSAGYAEQTNEIYREIGRLTGLDNIDQPNLAKVTEAFVDAWVEYHSNPASQAVRNELIRRADHMVTRLRDVSAAIGELRTDLTFQAHREVEELNAELHEVQRINERIAAAKSVGENSGALESQRDGVIESISKKLAVRVFPRDNAQIGLYTAMGHDLVDKGVVSQFYFDVNGSLKKTGLPVDAVFLDDAANYRLTEGTLLGKLNALRVDVVEEDAAVGILTRIERQLDAFAAHWTDNSAGSFRDAYDNLPASAPPRPGELDVDFFLPATATDRTNLEVNPLLLEDPDRLKRANLIDVVEALHLNARSIGMGVVGQDGRPLNIDDKNYLEVITALTDHWGLHINVSKEESEARTEGLERLTETIRSETGVDINEELSDLTVLQNAYAANARVMNAVVDMLDELLAVV